MLTAVCERPLVAAGAGGLLVRLLKKSGIDSGLGPGGADVAQRKAIAKPQTTNQVVTYRVGAQTYQIDTGKQKVYRQFVEIETARAFEIYASWRATTATA